MTPFWLTDAAMAAENIITGKVKPVYPMDIDRLAADTGMFLLDVRTAEEFITGAIPGAANIPLAVLRGHLPELPRDKTIVTICNRGKMSYFAARLLMQEGFTVLNLNGGFSMYKQLKTDLAGANMQDNPQPQPAQNPAAAMAACPKGSAVLVIDACGLQCPGPIMKLSAAIKNLPDGATIEITASDPGFKMDIAAWCRSTGNTLISASEEGRIIRACVRKGPQADTLSADELKPAAPQARGNNSRTMVVFSNDLDRAIAAFIIANGAAAMGNKVTMFFTFWGLNILRRENAAPVKKGFLDRMFGLMMPKGANRLKLSKMNFGGPGTALMKHVMRSKNVMPLPELIQQAQAQGVRIVACTMAMDIMGIQKSELIDGIETGGVASYLTDAQEAGTNLFI